MSKTVLIDGDGERRGMGWLPDHPDIRDRSADHAEVKPLLAGTSVPKLKPKAIPAKVDLRAWCSPIENQGSLGSCTAHAGVGMVEYCERRAHGKHIDASQLQADGLKVPHIGWSPVRWEKDSRLTEGIESETPFYFVHSFAPSPSPDDLLGSAAYGARFACAAERDNVFGVQFHPEKSSAAGLRLLSNFAGVCAATPAPA